MKYLAEMGEDQTHYVLGTLLVCFPPIAMHLASS